MKKILIINICKEKLHYNEFVKPIEDILSKFKIKYFVKHYSDLENSDLKKSIKTIISGTSLKDNEFIKDVNKFIWIINYNKPILGICGGMHIIGLVFGGKLKKKTEIGFNKEVFKKDFFGIIGEIDVYHLHNYYVDFDNRFDIYCKNNGVIQAVKYKEKEIYGVLFHPEVRNKDLIKNFVKVY